MPSGYDTYKIYHGIDLHFNSSSYDFIKYHGKSNVNPNMWYKRSDKYHFEVLGSKYKEKQLIGIFVSYFIQNIHVKKPFGVELTIWAREGYQKWLADVESLPKVFEKDLAILKERSGRTIKNLFKLEDGGLPEFLELIINKDINLASAIIFLDLIPETQELLNKCQDDIIWPAVSQQITKYKSFLNYDKEKYVNILKTSFNKTVDKKLKKS